MLNKLSISASALAVVAFAGAASAQNITYLDAVDDDGGATGADVLIEVVVEEIAELEVIDQAATMTIDNSDDVFMGNPTSGGNDFSNIARMELRSNFDVSSIQVDFPRTSGIRNFSSADWFGVASCVSGPCASGGTTTLGVFPAISQLDGSGNFINGGGVQQFHDGSNTAIVYDGDSGTASPGFNAGVTGFGLGVATNWGRTLVSEPVYAEPGTYEIVLTATLIP